MKRSQQPLQGFTIVEFLLILITLVLIGAVGFLVAKHIYNKPSVTFSQINHNRSENSSLGFAEVKYCALERSAQNVSLTTPSGSINDQSDCSLTVPVGLIVVVDTGGSGGVTSGV